jgi:nucleoid DNA-binding protein
MKKKVINKEMLSRQLAEELNLSPKQVKTNVEVIFKRIAAELKKENVIQIVGFGKFLVRKRKARVGRDPNTGARLNLPETDTPVFSPSRNLSKQVKGKL